MNLDVEPFLEELEGEEEVNIIKEEKKSPEQGVHHNVLDSNSLEFRPTNVVKNEEKPKVEEKPKDEEKPKVDEKPKVEEKPKVDEKLKEETKGFFFFIKVLSIS